jgi:hypothetical protein
MSPAEQLNNLLPPPEVTALGTPERVVALAQGCGSTEGLWGRMVMDPAFLAGAGLILVAGVCLALGGVAASVAPPVVLIVLFGAGALMLAAGGYLLLWCERRVNVKYVSAAYALYPETLAYLHHGRWAVVRWDEVVECRAGSPTGLLVTRDGTRLTLENGSSFGPSAVLREVETRARRAVPGCDQAPRRRSSPSAQKLRTIRLLYCGGVIALGAVLALIGQESVLKGTDIRVSTVGHITLGIGLLLLVTVAVCDQLGVDLFGDES